MVITDGKGTLVTETVVTKSSDMEGGKFGAPIPAPTDGSLVIKIDTGTLINMGKRHYYQGGQPT